ncbi:MAG: Protein of unknown function (DUF3185) [Idiomarinaceae bacterium HL-53]|nr:MAG: Protein of unknown function (DUF3185) [Idiomarinaceae bacterium HL-53]CUS49218.1 Protein of unknown function (DUF3185) [Idiomarinaceae bacterium HL-53]
MNKIVSIALIVAGAILLYFGWQEKESVASRASELVTNQPTDNAMWFLIAGAVAIVIGLGGLFVGKK